MVLLSVLDLQKKYRKNYNIEKKRKYVVLDEITVTQVELIIVKLNVITIEEVIIIKTYLCVAGLIVFIDLRVRWSAAGL